MHKKFLLAPGPTPVPEEARLAMARSLMHHRGPEFKALFGEVRQSLQWLYQTRQDVLVLTCSGTGAFEAAIINFTKKGDTVIAIGGGKFGERWAEVARAYELNVIEMQVPWGKAVSPERLAELLEQHPDCAMVTLSASETSTGVYHPLQDIAAVVKRHPQALFAVDGITAVGVHPIKMDELELDVLVSGSQKAFGIPPGLAFLAASDRAWTRYEKCDHPKYYFDLGRERDSQKQDQTAFTPAISLVVGMKEVLALMQAEGLEALYARHEQNSRAARAGVTALGLGLLTDSPTFSVTAAVVPDGVSAPDVVRYMRDRYGVTVAGGQDELKPRVVRIGHIGFFDRTDMLVAISAMELALRDAGVTVKSGSGVAAVQQVYA